MAITGGDGWTAAAQVEVRTRPRRLSRGQPTPFNRERGPLGSAEHSRRIASAWPQSSRVKSPSLAKTRFIAFGEKRLVANLGRTTRVPRRLAASTSSGLERAGTRTCTTVATGVWRRKVPQPRPVERTTEELAFGCILASSNLCHGVDHSDGRFSSTCLSQLPSGPSSDRSVDATSPPARVTACLAITVVSPVCRPRHWRHSLPDAGHHRAVLGVHLGYESCTWKACTKDRSRPLEQAQDRPYYEVVTLDIRGSRRYGQGCYLGATLAPMAIAA